MKLIIKANATDPEVWELVDIDRVCPVLICTLNYDAFLGTDLENRIEHAIEQNGFAEITISAKAVK